MKKSQSIPDDFNEILDETDDEEQNEMSLTVRIENLKSKLKEQQKTLTVTEYNKKRAVFEYLRRLDINENEKIKASERSSKACFY